MNKIEKYNAALELLKYEGEIGWQMNILFIALNVGLATVIGDKGFEKNSLLLMFMSFVGIIINLYWLWTFNRNSKYYNFRMAQARAAEPKHWNLLAVNGYLFSKGEKILVEDGTLNVEDRSHQLGKLETHASNKRALSIAIHLIIGGFVIIFIVSIFHLCSCSLTLI